MKKFKIPKLPKKQLKLCAYGISLLYSALAILQLVRFDKFLPEIEAQIGTNLGLFVGIITPALTIFSLIFLLGLKVPNIVKFLSGISVVVVPWIWMSLAIWLVGKNVKAVEFSTYAPFNVEWFVLAFNVILLAVALYLSSEMGIEKIYSGLTKRGKSSKIKK